jgi:hypothetical protein
VLLQSACFPADFSSWSTSSLDQDEFNDYRTEVGNCKKEEEKRKMKIEVKKKQTE